MKVEENDSDNGGYFDVMVMNFLAPYYVPGTTLSTLQVASN